MGIKLSPVPVGFQLQAFRHEEASKPELALHSIIYDDDASKPLRIEGRVVAYKEWRGDSPREQLAYHAELKRPLIVPSKAAEREIKRRLK